jgi:hypothetical protein
MALSDPVTSICSLGLRILDLVTRGVPSPSTELELPPKPGIGESVRTFQTNNESLSRGKLIKGHW